MKLLPPPPPVAAAATFSRFDDDEGEEERIVEVEGTFWMLIGSDVRLLGPDVWTAAST
jgi:hypothetical protein